MPTTSYLSLGTGDNIKFGRSNGYFISVAMQTIDIGKYNSAAFIRYPRAGINLNIRNPKFQAPIETNSRAKNKERGSNDGDKGPSPTNEPITLPASLI